MEQEMDSQGKTILKCKTCKGTGKRWIHNYKDLFVDRKKRIHTVYEQRECRYCSGIGYYESDWISAVLEQPYGSYIIHQYNKVDFKVDKTKLKARWTIDYEDTQAFIGEDVSKDLADRIDEEIMDNIIDNLLESQTYVGRIRRTLEKMYKGI